MILIQNIKYPGKRNFNKKNIIDYEIILDKGDPLPKYPTNSSQQKKPLAIFPQAAVFLYDFYGAPRKIRTPNPLVRSQMP